MRGVCGWVFGREGRDWGRGDGGRKEGRKADVPEDLEDLVDLRVAGEQRLARAHLREDAADGPHVHAGRVLAAAEQDLGRAVPQRDDLVGVRPQRDAKGSREAEVRKLEVPVAVDQQVLRLQVAVQHAVAVAVAHALAQLAHELLDHGVAEAQAAEVGARALGQRLAAPAVADRQRLHVLLQVEVEELEDEVQLVAVGVHDVEQPHDVRVVHLLQQRDLADRRRRHALVLGLEPDLLECHDASAVQQVARLVDHAVCACGEGVSIAWRGAGRSDGRDESGYTDPLRSSPTSGSSPWRVIIWSGLKGAWWSGWSKVSPWGAARNVFSGA